MATGDKSGSWGLTNNSNLGTLIEEAIVGYTTVPITDGANTVITIADGSTSAARHAVLALTGALTAARTLEVPAKEKTYIIYNATTGGFAVTVKVNGQTGVSVPAGKKRFVYNTGTDIVDAITDLPANTTFAGSSLLTEATTDIDMATGTFSGLLEAGSIKTGDGSVGVPAIAFSSEPNTGWYRSGTGQQAWSILGVARASLSASSFSVLGAITASGLGTFGSLTTATGTITTVGATTLNVAGSSNLHATGITGQLTVTGLTYTDSLIVVNNATVSGTLGVSVDLGVSRDVYITRNMTLSGTALYAPSATITSSIIRGGNVHQSGEIVLWPNPPTGNGSYWFVCNGQWLSRTTHAGIFNVLGDNYGRGDGSTSFAVPNIAPVSCVNPDTGGLVYMYYYIYLVQ
jgi:hypothetical protein